MNHDQHIRLWHLEKGIDDALANETDAPTIERLERMRVAAMGMTADREARMARATKTDSGEHANERV